MAPAMPFDKLITTPFPLLPTPCGGRSLDDEHGALQMAQAMAHVHNTLLRSLNCIYNQAPFIKTPMDVRDFMRLIQLWTIEITHHHTEEEAFAFPTFEELAAGGEKVMGHSVEQHHEFQPGLDKLKGFADAGVGAFDAEVLRGIIDGFGEGLQKHLKEEVDTLVTMTRFDSEKCKEALKVCHARAMKTSNPWHQLPLLLGSFDQKYEGNAAVSFPIPTPAYYITWAVYEWPDRAAWRFLPYTTFGQPRARPWMEV